MVERLTRADYLLAENIRTLIAARRVDAKELARACGHESSWISKILNGDRGMRVQDVGKAASFFGLTASELLSPWISPLTERRQAQRRKPTERRVLSERRQVDRALAPTRGDGVQKPSQLDPLGGIPVVHVSHSHRPSVEVSGGGGSLADIERAIATHIDALATLTTLRDRALASPAGHGADGAAHTRARTGTDAHAPTRRHTKKG